jgi:hypothetical protein
MVILSLPKDKKVPCPGRSQAGQGAGRGDHAAPYDQKAPQYLHQEDIKVHDLQEGEEAVQRDKPRHDVFRIEIPEVQIKPLITAFLPKEVLNGEVFLK